MISKERRHALRITQGPRSRASIAACHSSFQTPHSSLGATYNFQLCDSVPDLSSTGGSGFNESNSMNILANHSMSSSSAPRKISIKNGGFHSTNNNFGMATTQTATAASNTSSTTISTTATNSIVNVNNNNNNNNTNNNNNNNNILMNGYGTPLRMQNQNKKSLTSATNDYDNDDNVVQLRRRNALMSKISYENNSNEKQSDWMYRRPNAPNDIRHSCKYN